MMFIRIVDCNNSRNSRRVLFRDNRVKGRYGVLRYGILQPIAKRRIIGSARAKKLGLLCLSKCDFKTSAFSCFHLGGSSVNFSLPSCRKARNQPPTIEAKFFDQVPEILPTRTNSLRFDRVPGPQPLISAQPLVDLLKQLAR
jgi:hypothetical protein